MATILIKHTPGYMNDVNRRPLHQQGVSRCYRLGKLVAKKSDWSTLKVRLSDTVYFKWPSHSKCGPCAVWT